MNAFVDYDRFVKYRAARSMHQDAELWFEIAASMRSMAHHSMKLVGFLNEIGGELSNVEKTLGKAVERAEAFKPIRDKGLAALESGDVEEMTRVRDELQAVMQKRLRL